MTSRQRAGPLGIGLFPVSINDNHYGTPTGTPFKSTLPIELDLCSSMASAPHQPTAVAGDEPVGATESNDPTLEDQAPAQNAVSQYSTGRRSMLLALFCTAQFIDVFLASGVVIGIADISRALSMTPAESIWIINAYALTLGAFLLTGGRISDVWSAKPVFVLGCLWVGAFSIGIGFVKTKAGIFVLRALAGIGASLNIPAALRLIVYIYPEPAKQTMAIAIFGGVGAISNIVGLLLGGVLLLATWKWIFWFAAICAILIGVLSFIGIPADTDSNRFAPDGTVKVETAHGEIHERKPKMDYLGTFLQIAAIVLFIYGLTEANVKSWKKGEVLATLLIGLFIFPVFFWWQTKVDPIDALIKPRTWFLPNFLLISIISFTPYFWFYLVQVSFADIFQTVWGNSAILTAAKFIPIGLTALISVMIAGSVPPEKLSLKIRLIGGCILSAGGALIMSFAYNREDYWRLCFPGFIFGTVGTSFVYVVLYTSLVLSVPREESGVAAAVFNSVAQLGAALFLSLSTTIETQYPIAPGSPIPSSHGYKYAFLFSMSLQLLNVIGTLVFFIDPLSLNKDEAGVTGVEGEKKVEAGLSRAAVEEGTAAGQEGKKMDGSRG